MPDNERNCSLWYQDRKANPAVGSCGRLEIGNQNRKRQRDTRISGRDNLNHNDLFSRELEPAEYAKFIVNSRKPVYRLGSSSGGLEPAFDGPRFARTEGWNTRCLCYEREQKSMTEVAPPVSVIIPVHDGGRTLPHQLESLVEQTSAPRFEVMVVCNLCSDNSAEVALGYSRALDLKVVHANRKPSAAYARNEGVRHSSGRILLFCDADDRVNDEWVAAMHETIRRGFDFAGGGFVVDRAGLPEWAYRTYYGQFDGEPLKRTSTAFFLPISCNLAVTRSAFDSIGGFDDSFPGAGAEDNWFVQQLLSAGFRVGAANHAVVHYRPRRTVFSIAKQRRGYAPGKAYKLLLEGRLRAPRPHFRQAASLINFAIKCALGEKASPGEIFVRVADRFYRESARRELWNSNLRKEGLSAQETLVDSRRLLVPPEIPLIGGRAFEGSSSQVCWWDRRGVQALPLSSLAHLVRVGDSVIDLGAGIGVLSVWASLIVGTSGRVFACEPSRASALCLRKNAQRHGVSSVLAVRPDDSDRDAQLATPSRGLDQDVLSLLEERSLWEPPSLVTIDASRVEADTLTRLAQHLEKSADIVVFVRGGPASREATGSAGEEALDAFPDPAWAVWQVIPVGPEGPTIKRFRKDCHNGQIPTRPTGGADQGLLAVRGPRRP